MHQPCFVAWRLEFLLFKGKGAKSIKWHMAAAAQMRTAMRESSVGGGGGAARSAQ
jgi:hypothetical protein